MKQTALEYLRGLANSYAATEQVTISVSTLRDALAEKQALPSTGEMRHVADRICESLFGNAGIGHENVVNVLTDAPEIIALRMAKEATDGLVRENQTLYDNCVRIQAENRELEAKPFTATISVDSTMLEASIQAVKNELLKHVHCKHGVRGDYDCATCALDAKHEHTMRAVIPAPPVCPHGIGQSVCISCDAARGILHHSGKQGAYDSCTHDQGQYGAPCSTCEPERYDRARQRVSVMTERWKDGKQHA